MANLWQEGLGGLATGSTQSGLRFDSTPSASITTTTSPVPPNGQAVRNASAGGVNVGALKNVPTHTVGFFGERVLPSDIGTTYAAAGNILVAFYDASGVRNFYITLNAAGRLEARNTAGTVYSGGTGTGVYSLVDYLYLEVSYTMSATVGAIEVKVTRGSTVTTEFTLTGINNVNGAANIGQIGVAWTSGTGVQASYPACTDFYLNDNTGGGADATYWGDTRYAYKLITGAGSSAAMTPSAGSNFACVDEAPGHNSDTDYVESNVSGNRDLYAGSTIVSTATVIRGVKVITTARAPNGAASMKIDVKSGATVSVGPSVGLSTGAYREETRQMPINPVTAAAWTLSEVSALEFGQEKA